MEKEINGEIMLIQWLLYVALSIYCLLDAYQTKLLLDLGAYEMNPMLAWIMEASGTWLSMLFVKIILLITLGFLLLMQNYKGGDLK